MAFRKFSMAAVVVMAVVMMSWMTSARAMTTAPPDMSCIQALAPCMSFLNATKPSKECCGPLETAFKTQLKCLCAAFNNPAIAAAANINVTQVAVTLPMNCGIDANPAMCSNAPKPSEVAPKALAPEAASTPGATPYIGKPAPPPGTGAASSITPVFGFVLVVAGFMFY